MQLAVSRRRETLADVSAVQMTRYPPGLISALEKLKDDSTVVHALIAGHRPPVDRAADGPDAGGRKALPAQPAVRHPPATRGAHRPAPGALNRTVNPRMTRRTLLVTAAGRPRGRRLQQRVLQVGRHHHDHRRHDTARVHVATAADHHGVHGAAHHRGRRPATRSPGWPSPTRPPQNRPALVVKIDNHPEARPQTGLNQADVVFEEQVEGITRFFAVFQSGDSNPVGPIRSARTTDVNIVAMLAKPLFAWSGGNPTVTAQIRRRRPHRRRLRQRQQDRRLRALPTARTPRPSSTRSTPTRRSSTRSPREGRAPPAPLFTVPGRRRRRRRRRPRRRGEAAARVDPRAVPLGRRRQGVGAAARTASPTSTTTACQIAPANVVVHVHRLREREGPAVAQPGRGVTVGSGEAWVFTDGKVVKGTWDREDPSRAAGAQATPRPGDRASRPAARGWSCPNPATPTLIDRRRVSPRIGRLSRRPDRLEFEPMSSSAAPRATGTFRVKRGLAEMLKGGVIMDVVDAEQAKVAEDAGAVAVMALERVPADIRRDGGVARMSDPAMIEGIKAAVTIPVMAKARIGHFAEAQILEALGVDYIDESEVLTPADEAHHIDKWAFTVPVRVRRHQPGRGPAPHLRGRGA